LDLWQVGGDTPLQQLLHWHPEVLGEVLEGGKLLIRDFDT
jgi:hypothetical protein